MYVWIIHQVICNLFDALVYLFYLLWTNYTFRMTLIRVSFESRNSIFKWWLSIIAIVVVDLLLNDWNWFWPIYSKHRILCWLTHHKLLKNIWFHLDILIISASMCEEHIRSEIFLRHMLHNQIHVRSIFPVVVSRCNYKVLRRKFLCKFLMDNFLIHIELVLF